MRAVAVSVAVLGALALWAGHPPPAMAQARTPASSNPAASTNGAFSSNVNTAGPIAPDKTHPLDLNAASAAELNALPGISADRSDAIVAGRPYRSKDDLVRRGILPKTDYERIKDFINIQKR